MGLVRASIIHGPNRRHFSKVGEAMEDYQEMPEAVALTGENQFTAAKSIARKKATGQKRKSTGAGKSGTRSQRGKKRTLAKKKKTSGGTRGVSKKAKGRPAGAKARTVK
jgi:hypothetical protein